MSGYPEQKNFLERLQEADDDTKKWWVVIGTVVIMSAVVFVWLGYFNNLIAGNIRRTEPAPITEEKGEFTFFDTMRNGVASIFHSFKGGVEGIINGIGGSRSYDIAPSE